MKIIFDKFLSSVYQQIILLLAVKTIFLFILLQNGMRWLSADDYSRTVISWEWLQHPRIYSGVWLSFHFWLNGIFIAVFKDLTLAPILVSVIFSSFMLVYFYLLCEKLFGKIVALFSSVILCVFPFQVWLSASAMPEPVFFFFVTFSAYYFIRWFTAFHKAYKNSAYHFLLLSAIGFNFANMLRYEGWFFSFSFILVTGYYSFRKFRFTKNYFISLFISICSLLSAAWWLVQNYLDYGNMLYFIKETTRIYEHLNTAGFFQRLVQYPFFIYYIAPLTSIPATWIVYKIFRKKNGFWAENSDTGLLRFFLTFLILELLILMFSGIYGSGGTNMISRYIVLNAVFLFPFSVQILSELRKYFFYTSVSAVVVVNIVWSFYYQEAYREDTFEVSYLTKKLIQKNYFAQEDKIYFEMTEGYFDIYPLQVISNSPDKIISDTIPSVFPVTIPSKKMSRKKREEERQRLNIIELRKFLEAKNVKLFIARSDLLIDKIKKLSYKNEQVGDYHIFYLAENALSAGKNGNPERKSEDFTVQINPGSISFDKKLVLRDFKIDNTNLGINPQTIMLKWQLAEIGMLDSLGTDEDNFGRFKAKIELAPQNMNSAVYDSYTNIFSERNTEEFFEIKEIKTILVLRPFALLNYSRRQKPAPFESGLYDIRLSVVDAVTGHEMRVFQGDSLYNIAVDTSVSREDTLAADTKSKKLNMKKFREYYISNPFYPLGKLVAVFPNADYNRLMKSSGEVAKMIIRNGLMLPFLQRYQGDQMLNIVFNYF